LHVLGPHALAKISVAQGSNGRCFYDRYSFGDDAFELVTTFILPGSFFLNGAVLECVWISGLLVASSDGGVSRTGLAVRFFLPNGPISLDGEQAGCRQNALYAIEIKGIARGQRA